MPLPFFNEERTNQLEIELARWEATPFLQYGETPGKGVDCIRFVAGVLGACGVVIPQLPAEYSLTRGLHHPDSQLLQWLHDSAGESLKLVDAEGVWMPGDLALFRTARSIHHVGIVAPNGFTVWHVDLVCGVVRISRRTLEERRHARVVTLRRIYDL